MAEVTAMRNNALPYPVYALPWVVAFPLLDADGDPVSPSSPDSEVSKNGDTFADCTNEAVEIATTSGSCYLILTAAEMTADVVTVQIKSTGAKTTVLVLYPKKLPVLSSGTCQGSNDTGDIQLASGDSPVDDIYNGCLCVATIDTVVEARIINDYVGSTKVAEVSPAWVTAQPDSNDTYVIYLPEGRSVNASNVVSVAGTAQTAGDLAALIADLPTNAELATALGTADDAVLTAIGDLPTNAELATALGTADDAVLAAIAALNNLSAAQVNAEVDTALGDYDAPTRAELTSDINSVLSKLLKYVQLVVRKDAAIGTDNATEKTAINADGGSGAGAFDQATDSQEAIRDNQQTAAAAALTAYDPPTRTEATSDKDEILTAVADVPTNSELATALAAADDAVLSAIGDLPTAAENADAVWDETLADHLGAGSTGNALNAAGSAGDPWSTALPGAYGAGSAGKIIGDNINATISSRATQTSVDDLPTNAELATALAAADDAVLAAIAALNNLSQANIRTAVGLASANLDTQLDALPTNAELATALGTADDAVLAAIAALNNLSQANVRSAVGLASANLDTQLGDLPTNSELATALGTADDAVLAAIAALNNLSAAQVNAEVVDALATDTYAEPTGVPAATASLAAKLGRLHQALRNRIDVNATKKTFYDDANAALWEKDLSDDGTDYSESEGNAI